MPFFSPSVFLAMCYMIDVGGRLGEVRCYPVRFRIEANLCLLRFIPSERCVYIKEKKREVKSKLWGEDGMLAMDSGE